MRVLKYLGNVLVVAVAVVLILVALLMGLKAFGLSDPALEAVGITTRQSQATSNDGNATQAADPTEQGRAEPSDAATPPEAVPTPMPTPEAVPTPETNPEAAASPAEPIDPVTATEAVNRYLAAEPWYGPQEMGTSIVDTVVVEGDDVIVTFVTDP